MSVLPRVYLVGSSKYKLVGGPGCLEIKIVTAVAIAAVCQPSSPSLLEVLVFIKSVSR